jgi:hypothetical protein
VDRKLVRYLSSPGAVSRQADRHDNGRFDVGPFRIDVHRGNPGDPSHEQVIEQLVGSPGTVTIDQLFEPGQRVSLDVDGAPGQQVEITIEWERVVGD